MIRLLTAATTACLTLLAPALSAQDSSDTPARVTNGQQFGAWTVACEALAVNETTCVLNQRLFRSEDRVFLAQIVGFWSGDGERRYLSARVPVGAYLPAGFAIRAEDGTEEDVIAFTWQACSEQLCEALIELQDDQIAALGAEGSSVVASYRPGVQAEPLVFRLSMTGLDAGLTALRPATD